MDPRPAPRVIAKEARRMRWHVTRGFLTLPDPAAT
jgi:hypothetical protein